MLEFATIDGARSIMLEDKVGSLKPGKQADIVLLKTDVINTAPVLDPKATIVTFADTSNVDSVYVAGNAVKRGGQLIGVDMKSVVGKLEESRNHILSAGALQLSKDGKTLFTATYDNGDHPLFAIDIGNGKATRLGAPGHVEGFSVRGNDIVVARSTMKPTLVSAPSHTSWRWRVAPSSLNTGPSA